MSGQRDPASDRKKLFRRMEWVYIYLPPVLAVAFAGLGGLVVAALLSIEGTTFRGRWVLGTLAILLIPTIAYFAREAVRKR